MPLGNLAIKAHVADGWRHFALESIFDIKGSVAVVLVDLLHPTHHVTLTAICARAHAFSH